MDGGGCRPVGEHVQRSAASARLKPSRATENARAKHCLLLACCYYYYYFAAACLPTGVIPASPRRETIVVGEFREYTVTRRKVSVRGISDRGRPRRSTAGKFADGTPRGSHGQIFARVRDEST